MKNIDIKGIPSIDTAIYDILEDFRKKLVKEVTNEVYKKLTMERDDDLLTTSQVRDILHVHPCTLWEWNKTGYLVPQKIGKRNYYTRGQIKEVANRA